MPETQNQLSPTFAYWQLVRETVIEIQAAAAKQSLQPRNGTFWITSIRNRKLGTVEGKLSEAVAKVAAQMIVDGTHKLSDDSEIQQYKTEEAAKQKLARGAQAARDNTIVLSAPREDN